MNGIDRPHSKRLTKNAAQCLECLDIVESKHRHDFVSCRCGAMFTDGGLSYIRRGAKDADRVLDLSEYEVSVTEPEST